VNTSALLEVSGLTVSFTSHADGPHAIDDIAFAVDRQRTLGLVGESGSGKTLSSLAILRLVPPPARIQAGRITFDGQDLLALNQAQMAALRGRRIAMVFQNPAYSLNPILSISAQLAEILSWHEKLSRRAARERVIEMLRLVGITDAPARARQFPHELSGGMKQRICIARALLCHPELILADEPTTNLDVTIQAQILDLLQEMKERFATSMILVTHDMGVVARMADRICVMYAGAICEEADAMTIFRSPSHPYTRALLDSMPRADQSYSGVRSLPVIPGRIPNLAEPPSGCRFHPRCPEAGADCQRFRPLPVMVSPGHVVSCLRRGSRPMQL